MIKVIASDLDGTLLNEQHKLGERTVAAIHKAQENGIRFMVATGRNFKQAMVPLGEADISCDYIVSSGAEVRNPKQEIWHTSCMDIQECKKAYEVMKKYPIAVSFGADEVDYCIGEPGSLEEQVLDHIFAFNQSVSKEDLRKSELFQRMAAKTRMVSDFDALAALNPRITKVFAFTARVELLAELEKELRENPKIAVASSFPNNLEITDVSAQKGPVLKAYIESLGYAMDEVMVFGDSLNDYSMLSMDFGATIAMENAHPKIKQAAKYVTKSNAEDGVAYTIEELLRRANLQTETNRYWNGAGSNS